MLARQYEIFLEVCRTGQFTKAAKSLGISQSAVSQCIKSLEDTLKIELLDRIARPVRITEEGRMLKEVLELQQRTFHKTLNDLQTRNFLKPALRLGLIESIAQNISVSWYDELFPNCSQISIHTGTSDDLYEKLINNQIDIAITSNAYPKDDRIGRLFICSEPNVIVAPKGTGMKSINGTYSWQSLKACGLPFARYTSNTASAQQSLELLSAYIHEDLPKRYEVDTHSLLFELIKGGKAWTIAQPLALLGENESLLEMLDVLPLPSTGPNRSIWVLYPEHESLGWHVRLRDICRKMIEHDLLPKIIGHIPWLESQYHFDTAE